MLHSIIMWIIVSSFSYNLDYNVQNYRFSLSYNCLVVWGCRRHRLHLCRGVSPPPTKESPGYDTKASDGKTWSFGKHGVPFHCHYSQVHSAPEWLHLLGSYSWVKNNFWHLNCVQTNNMLNWIELLKIGLLDHLTLWKQLTDIWLNS